MENMLIIKTLELLIGIAIFLFTKYGVGYINQIMNTEKFQKVMAYAEIAVKSAEKLYGMKKKAGEQKKEYALDLMENFANRIGYAVERDTLEAIMESALQDMELAKKEA